MAPKLKRAVFASSAPFGISSDCQGVAHSEGGIYPDTSKAYVLLGILVGYAKPTCSLDLFPVHPLPVIANLRAGSVSDDPNFRRLGVNAVLERTPGWRPERRSTGHGIGCLGVRRRCPEGPVEVSPRGVSVCWISGSGSLLAAGCSVEFSNGVTMMHSPAPLGRSPVYGILHVPGRQFTDSPA